MSDETTTFFRRQMAKLPDYWRLSTLRCAIYATVVAVNTFMAGVEGYNALSEMTPLQQTKLGMNVLVAALGVWIAFLDQRITGLKTPDSPQVATEKK